MAILRQGGLLLTILISLLIGIFLSLHIEAIRYTELVKPAPMVGIEPTILHATIESQDPNNYLFLDVRTAGEYERLHAALSTNMPIVDLYDSWPTLPRDSDTKIYLICSGGRLSAVAYEFLQLHGFQNIVHVTGGIQNWSASDLPTVSPSLFPEETQS